jgi:hypothetical protein
MQGMCQSDFLSKTGCSAQGLLSFREIAAHELRDSEVPSSKFQVPSGDIEVAGRLRAPIEG